MVEALHVEDEERDERVCLNSGFFRRMSTKELLTYRKTDEDEATQRRTASLPSMMEDLVNMELTMTATHLSSARAACLTSLLSPQPRSNFFCDI